MQPSITPTSFINRVILVTFAIIFAFQPFFVIKLGRDPAYIVAKVVNSFYVLPKRFKQSILVNHYLFP